MLVEGLPTLERLLTEYARLQRSTMPVLVQCSFLSGCACEVAVGTVVAFCIPHDRGNVTTQFRKFSLDMKPPVLFISQYTGLKGVSQAAGISSSIIL